MNPKFMNSGGGGAGAVVVDLSKTHGGSVDESVVRTLSPPAGSSLTELVGLGVGLLVLLLLLVCVGISASLQLGQVLNSSPYAMSVNVTAESGAVSLTSAEFSKHGPSHTVLPPDSLWPTRLLASSQAMFVAWSSQTERMSTMPLSRASPIFFM